MNPEASQILHYFEYLHLPAKLQIVASSFESMAVSLEEKLPRGPEKSVALRKLLESRDSAIRACEDLPILN